MRKYNVKVTLQEYSINITFLFVSFAEKIILVIYLRQFLTQIVVCTVIVQKCFYSATKKGTSLKNPNLLNFSLVRSTLCVVCELSFFLFPYDFFFSSVPVYWLVYFLARYFLIRVVSFNQFFWKPGFPLLVCIVLALFWFFSSISSYYCIITMYSRIISSKPSVYLIYWFSICSISYSIPVFLHHTFLQD